MGAFLVGASAPAEAESLQVTVTTTAGGGNYAPRNVVAVWIENQSGTFVKTIGRWANNRKRHLVAWTQKAGSTDADAVSGATRQNHATPLNITWNVLDKQNQPLPDGTYTIRMESADMNSSSASQNHQGTFTFVKGPAAQNQSGLMNGGFNTVSIAYDPGTVTPPATCNNGVVDPGEMCDPAAAGSCPTTCASSGDACAPNVLVGSATACSAACAEQPITTCIDGDGCCADGCDAATDEDCAAGDGTDIGNGCATGNSSSPFLMAALLSLLIAGRRRRRS